MLRYPVNYVAVTQPFTATHRGVDLGWKDSPLTPVCAAADGVVVDCGTERVYGAIYAVLRHPRQGGWCYTLYWHLRSLEVVRGQTVAQGARLGIMGDTGVATGVHLHYEVWLTPTEYTAWRLADKERYAVDPRQYTYLYPDQQVSPSTAGILRLPPDEPAPLTLRGEPLYASSTSTAAVTSVSGSYWRWDGESVRGRIRITNAPERIGVAGQVTGWIADPDVAWATHTVVAGDTLSAIAARNGLTLSRLIGLNPQIPDPNRIYVGQTVYLS